MMKMKIGVGHLLMMVLYMVLSCPPCHLDLDDPSSWTESPVLDPSSEKSKVHQDLHSLLEEEVAIDKSWDPTD